jgi:hypothetical protein
MPNPQPESLAASLSRVDLPLSMLITPGLVPVGELATPGVSGGSPPKNGDRRNALADEGPDRPAGLPYQLTRAYDLSVSGAIEANIPVAGSGAFSASRRVIVLERVGYQVRAIPDGVTEHVGFAIRLCVTVNKLDANVKLSLPFITASAQLGSTEAVWMLQIIGLTGPKIAAVEIIPTELNVETFVIAKQSLQRLIEALNDAETRLDAKVIARQGPPTTIEARYSPMVLQAAALGALARGWSAQDAASRFHWDLTQIPSWFTDVYQDIAAIATLTDRPSREVIGVAARLLGNVSVGPR